MAYSRPFFAGEGRVRAPEDALLYVAADKKKGRIEVLSGPFGKSAGAITIAVVYNRA